MTSLPINDIMERGTKISINDPITAIPPRSGISAGDITLWVPDALRMPLLDRNTFASLVLIAVGKINGDRTTLEPGGQTGLCFQEEQAELLSACNEIISHLCAEHQRHN